MTTTAIFDSSQYGLCICFDQIDETGIKVIPTWMPVLSFLFLSI